MTHPATRPSTTPLRVLVIEDVATDAELMIREVQRAGYIVEWTRVCTEEDFLRELENTPDLILSDYSMPRFDGLQAVDLLRKRNFDIPFILVSGTLGEDAAVNAIKAGANDYLLKDRITRLGSAIQRTLQEKRLRDERKRNEAERARLARQLELLLASTGEGIYGIDIEGNCTFINRAAAEMLDCTPAEALGQDMHELAHHHRPDGSPYPVEQCPIYRAFNSGRHCRVDTEVFWKVGGGAFPVEYSSFPIFEDGRISGAVVTFTDITERKGAERRLAAQYAATLALAGSSTLPEAGLRMIEAVCVNLGWVFGILWMIDPPAAVLRCAALWHPSRAEFDNFEAATQPRTFARGCGLPGRVWERGQAEWVGDVTVDPGFVRAPAAVQAGLRTGLAVPIRVQGELAGVLEFFCQQSQKPNAETLVMADALGSQIGQFIERKQIEEQLRQAQKMEAIGQLAGGVAHDFNNVLAAIMMHSDLLGMGDSLAQETREGLCQIRSYAERAANLTRQLLLFSRRQIMQPRELDLNEIVASVGNMLQRIIGEDVRLQLHLSPTPLITRADAGMLDQVLLNLAVNARDAMPGGGRLLIETSQEATDATTAHPRPDAASGPYVCFSVTDNGCGISPEIMPRIFEPFFTTKEPGKGTGLGLATVFGIVKQHQGRITVDSEPGKGTRFRILLPACEAAKEGRSRPAESPKPHGGSETILLVEDEPAVRLLTRVTLERNGYRVLEASNGIEALDVWRARPAEIALLLTDLVMPGGLSGQQLARQLEAESPGLKVIFTSGYSAEIAGRELEMSNGETFVQKPSLPADLLEAVRRCLDG